jgi:hypothetical protein
MHARQVLRAHRMRGLPRECGAFYATLSGV